jgi:hypothetical protein
MVSLATQFRAHVKKISERNISSTRHAFPGVTFELASCLPHAHGRVEPGGHYRSVF